MNICPECRAEIGSGDLCSNCGWKLATVDGYPAFAPDLLNDHQGYDEKFYKQYSMLESDHFWFRSRRSLILWALRKYCPNLSSFLEIGCGTGYVLEGISKQAPSATLIGSEMLVSGLRLATERQIPRSQFLQMDARKIPFKSEFDAIGLFDVLEHIKEDIDSLVGIREALLPNGLIFLTVPQHKWLWSDVDVYAHHQRRYNSDELNDKLISSGFKVVRSTSFVTSLLPAMLASRALGKRSQSSDGAEFAISPILNAIFLRMMEVEVALISKNINFPFGGSRLVVAQRLP